MALPGYQDYHLTEEQLHHYRDEGYIILRGILPPEHIEAMKTDLRQLAERSAHGDGPELPWIDKEQRIPARIGQLLRPGYIQPSFIDSIENGPFLPVAEQLLNFPVRYSLFGMLASGAGAPYIQNWHRDLPPPEGPDEVARLERGYRTYTQINAPLLPDRYLTIVPGSHLRPLTEAEKATLQHDATGAMPGQITVKTEPGDIAFYYSNMLHRGYNPTGQLRWTMHHAFLRADAPVCAHEGGQQEWIEQPGYLESLPLRTKVFMQRYVENVPAGEPQPFVGL